MKLMYQFSEKFSKPSFADILNRFFATIWAFPKKWLLSLLIDYEPLTLFKLTEKNNELF